MELISVDKNNQAAYSYYKSWGKFEKTDESLYGFIEGSEFAQDELKNIAIEFAKWMFSQEITKCRSMTESESYIPKEFNLMKGELMVAGESLLEQFLKEYNGR